MLFLIIFIPMTDCTCKSTSKCLIFITFYLGLKPLVVCHKINPDPRKPLVVCHKINPDPGKPLVVCHKINPDPGKPLLVCHKINPDLGANVQLTYN